MDTTTKSILIVDDDDIVRLVIEKFARMKGVEDIDTSAGPGVAEMIAGEKTYDLIFLDLLMPGITGWDVLQLLDASPTNKDARVVIMSGAPISSAETKKLKDRVHDVIDKESFTLADFSKALETLI